MTLVVDSSVVVAALTDAGPAGLWAETLMGGGEPLAAPHLMPVEAANILRRLAAHDDIGADTASLAHAALLSLPVELFPYIPLADRAWQLRANLTTYDAWYVALAEAIDATLVTLDARLGRAPGPRCRIVGPP